MDTARLITRLESALPSERLVRSPETLAEYGINVSGFVRDIPLVLRPTTTEEVQKIVVAAAAENIPLYPISTGKNWGLGSRLPVRDGCVVVDLSGMRKIRTISEEFGYAEIEPGVTQRDLSEALGNQGSRFYLDVTGSGADTSIVGNTLERGIAYNTLRAELVLKLEVVCGNGKRLVTGFGGFPNSQISEVYPFGVGPDLRGLFLQSNFGIVTALTLQLMPRPESIASFMINIPDSDRLAPLIMTLRELKRQGLLASVVHIGNRRRRLTATAPIVHDELSRRGRNLSQADVERLTDKMLKGQWSAIGTLHGPPALVRTAKRAIKSACSRYGQLIFVSEKKLKFASRLTELLGWHSLRALLTMGEAAFGMTSGVPTNLTLKSVYWPRAAVSSEPENPDKSPAGLLFSLPIVPMRADAINGAVKTIESFTDAQGFPAAVTLNMLHDKALEGVINIDFNLNENRDRAHAVINALNQEWVRLGFFPYRVDIGSMGLLTQGNPEFWNIIKNLKNTLDPSHIIAPGRYNLV